MIEVYYEPGEIFGYPGPHLFFRGTTVEAFVKLGQSIAILSTTLTSLELKSLDFIKIKGTDKRIVFKSSEAGGLLAKETELELITDLTPKHWGELYAAADQLTKGSYSSSYFLFDVLEDDTLIEEYMMTWEC